MTFKEQPTKPNIFESFEYMDRREDYIRAQRDHNPDFEQYFEECCTAYKENPEEFQPQKRSYYAKKNNTRRTTRPNFGYRKYSNNGNGYHTKTSYYKKNGGNWHNGKAVNIEEQFVVKTESKQNKKEGEKDIKRQEKGNEAQEKKGSDRHYESEENHASHNRYQDENLNSSNMQSAQ